MKTLYLDCGMGAAGDMLTAALLELTDDADAFVAQLNAVGIPDVTFTAEPAVKCGIVGTHMTVRVRGRVEGEPPHEHTHDHAHDHEHDREHDHGHTHHHDHTHTSLHDIGHIVSHLAVSDAVRSNILAVYTRIAEAESRAHGVPVTEIHFHEVGTMDAVADVTAVCMLMEALDVRQIVVSPVHVGAGQVRCAHGILPVPTPATADILRDCPIYGGQIRGELCTPTGAALLRHFADRFGDMPCMRTEKIGYGMGTKDFPAANCVRAFLGETDDGAADTVTVFTCAIDDMTGEEIGFAVGQLAETDGVLDVYTTPVQMKKNRPGVELTVLCKPEQKQETVEQIFRLTATLGVRAADVPRFTLARRTRTCETARGTARRKISTGFGVTREKTEYEDAARIAREDATDLRAAREKLE